MSDKSKKMFHIAYEFEGQNIQIGEKVLTLCGKKKRVSSPDPSIPVCGYCFEVYATDVDFTGAASDVLLVVLQGITDVLNNGRQKYIDITSDKVRTLIGGGIKEHEERV